MYKQTLYKIIDPIRINTLKRLNKGKKWKYGYNKEHDIIVISKTGEIGEIYDIQNLKIALPKPIKVYSKSKKKSEQYWEKLEDKQASRIAIYREGSIDSDEAELEDVKKWAIKNLLKFKKSFEEIFFLLFFIHVLDTFP